MVEYTLQAVSRPIGVATYETRDALATEMQAVLPTPEALHAEVAAALADERAAIKQDR
jgi:hypothetical protein